MLATLPRLDREGLALARELVKAIERLPWAQTAWLLDQGELAFILPSERGERQAQARIRWSDTPWQSHTLIRVRVEAIVRGRHLPTLLAHRDYGAHETTELPATPPPAPTPVDLTSLQVRQA